MGVLRVRRLAQMIGESMTRAVDQAATERLDRLERQQGREAKIERILEIGRRVAALPLLDPRLPDEVLYDEDGLPK